MFEIAPLNARETDPLTPYSRDRGQLIGDNGEHQYWL